MKKILKYLNPLAQLGKKRYSLAFPLTFSLVVCIISEIYANQIVHNPGIVGRYIILVNVASLIYFSFRDGVRAGIIASIIPILYYVYIIYSRDYTGTRLTSGIVATVSLGALYLIIAGIIGWLKQTIDNLIEKEQVARIHAQDAKTRLEAIMEQLPVGVILTDKEGSLDMSNKQADLIGGMKIPGFTLGKPETYPKNNKFYAHENNKPLGNGDWPLVQSFKTGKPVEKYISLERPDGKELYLQVKSSIIRNKKKEVLAGATIITDITQQKEIEDRKDDFINMASHELKTPLTSTKLFIKSFEKHLKNNGDEKGVQLLGKIDKQMNKLTHLVKELLDVTNINRGQLKLTKEQFPISEVIKETIEDLGPTTKQQFQIKNVTNHIVNADKEKIMQVLANFITNAIKYSRSEDIIIKSKKENNSVVVGVQDFGIGIPKNQQKKIFGRFYQAHKTAENTYPGIGLGLFIASEIINLHKGKIWVESELDKGSTFYFSLPAKS